MYIRFAFIIVAGASLNFSLSKEIAMRYFLLNSFMKLGDDVYVCCATMSMWTKSGDEVLNGRLKSFLAASKPSHYSFIPIHK